MPRKPRFEAEGATHHVVSRGVDRTPIFFNDEDRRSFLRRLGRTVSAFDWRCLTYCLMGNHYHLLLQTAQPNLCDGMRSLNGGFATAVNRRVGRTGHLLERRYRSTRVIRNEHLLECFRYIALNPVKDGFCADPADWPWGAHRVLLGHSTCDWLDVPTALGYFAGAGANGGRDQYGAFVGELSGVDLSTRTHRPPLEDLLSRYELIEAFSCARDCGYSVDDFLTAAGVAESTFYRLLARTSNA